MQINKKLDTVFSSQTSPYSPLFVFELANNHMGDAAHAKKIISEVYRVARNFGFLFAFKFQFRDIATFIHPNYRKKSDIPYVKRFSRTKLAEKDIRMLKKLIDKIKFISIATPFDERSVDLIKKLDIDIVKIASCSFTDWPLLEKIAAIDKPIIASTAGSTLTEIDNVVSFFQHREKIFALMHCIGEYPAPSGALQLNQIDLLKSRYPGVPIGFSTHEDPENLTPVQIAVSKGARILERHVGVPTDKYKLNPYTSTPEQIKKWLTAAARAISICGVEEDRYSPSEKEMSDLRQFQRGIFAAKKITRGDQINSLNTYLAFPNFKNQLVGNDMSKYLIYYAAKDYKTDEAIILVNKIDIRKNVYTIITKVQKMLSRAKIILPNRIDVEISHHYGLDNFYKFGAVILNCINRDYCKKIIVMFPGQQHPEHFHVKKEETFHILHGDFHIELNGEKRNHKAGDIVTIERQSKHSFMSDTGGIFEEVSTTNYINDSFYEDDRIMKNLGRKTLLTYWAE